MSAAALLARNPAPSQEDIDRAMAGNICRCGTYLRIRKAIQSASSAIQSGVALFDPGEPDLAASPVDSMEVSS
jgi:xanthine dehydrogenase iron-sulfur cluster and FAD-binding subunit A